ncbi:hypothetical protein NC652_028525 [Populus alba x Populus x berolinensis]|nr:hypothetical protein NC652_028525 [Populus alba x Populus x berolinensis]
MQEDSTRRAQTQRPSGNKNIPKTEEAGWCTVTETWPYQYHNSCI